MSTFPRLLPIVLAIAMAGGAPSTADASGAERLARVAGRSLVARATGRTAAGEAGVAASRVAERRALAQVDAQVLQGVGARWGAYVDPRRLHAAQRSPARLLTEQQYHARLRQIFPDAKPEEVAGVLGDFRRGRVTVNRQHLAFRTTLAHERLHQLTSPGFRAGTGRRFQEGVTEYFALRTQRDPLRGTLPDVYTAEQRIASVIEARVGEGPLARAYFRGELGALRTAVDRDLGRGSLDRALRALEQGNDALALRILAPGH